MTNRVERLNFYLEILPSCVSHCMITSFYDWVSLFFILIIVQYSFILLLIMYANCGVMSLLDSSPIPECWLRVRNRRSGSYRDFFLRDLGQICDAGVTWLYVMMYASLSSLSRFDDLAHQYAICDLLSKSFDNLGHHTSYHITHAFRSEMLV